MINMPVKMIKCAERLMIKFVQFSLSAEKFPFESHTLRDCCPFIDEIGPALKEKQI